MAILMAAMWEGLAIDKQTHNLHWKSMTDPTIAWSSVVERRNSRQQPLDRLDPYHLDRSQIDLLYPASCNIQADQHFLIFHSISKFPVLVYRSNLSKD
jgi:hypothetical protein